jgi:hypothetical protein
MIEKIKHCVGWTWRWWHKFDEETRISYAAGGSGPLHPRKWAWQPWNPDFNRKTEYPGVYELLPLDKRVLTLARRITSTIT